MSASVHDILTASHQDSPISWIGDTLSLWHSRIVERRAYASLDRRDLQDLGLSRWAIEREMAKPFWRR